ncbi:hypothetical protein OIU74_017123 [Salix koriyanagi]|uniref:Uncharacterized protein n=1 Tax=Salix koriyanagi TaxID=2511006 RepID=A0A9Q0PI49_9ROSI|nr:hypothetical protein OIU74_017123 [Salix koriyanagi]
MLELVNQSLNLHCIGSIASYKGFKFTSGAFPIPGNIRGWLVVERIREEKHKYDSALKLAEELIKKNQRYWLQSINAEPTEVNINALDQRGRGAQSEGQGGRGREGEGGGGGVEVRNSENVRPSTEENTGHETPSSPLFIETSNGVVEIAQEILDKFPQSTELVNQMG